MDGFSIVGLIVLLLGLAAVVSVGMMYLRRRWLSRQTHAFDCSIKPSPGAHWALGVARYQGSELQWYRVFGLSWRPARRFRQGEWTAVASRRPTRDEAALLYSTGEVMELRPARATGVEPLEIAVEPASAMGLRSWLESAAPGAANYGSTSR